MQLHDPTDPLDCLNRHALVMAIWSPLLLISAGLFHKAILSGNEWWFVGAFFSIIIAFCGHIIINVTIGTSFTDGETALGSFLFSIAVVAFLLTLLFGPVKLTEQILIPVGLGLVSLLVSVVVNMLISYGPRRAFEKFDIIRDNNKRPASSLPHRGGRR